MWTQNIWKLKHLNPKYIYEIWFSNVNNDTNKIYQLTSTQRWEYSWHLFPLSDYSVNTWNIPKVHDIYNLIKIITTYTIFEISFPEGLYYMQQTHLYNLLTKIYGQHLHYQLFNVKELFYENCQTWKRIWHISKLKYG